MNTKKSIITDEESSVSLRIASKTLSCAEITKILKWQPSKQFAKGEPVVKSNPQKLRDEFFWIYDLNLDEHILFEQHLETLVKMILKKKRQFQRELRGCKIDIFCGYTSYNGQGGVALDSKLMGELASLNVDFLISFYSLSSSS